MATINLGSIKFNWKGTYAGGTAYVVDDVVEYNGSSYICILASTGNLPTNATYFEQMSSAGTNGTDGTDLGTTLTTQGDIVYRDASGLQRLGAGTSGQVLQTGGTGANPSWGTVSSDFVRVGTATVSGSATTTFLVDNVFSSNYDQYMAVINLRTGDNNHNLFMRFLNGSGSQLTNGWYRGFHGGGEVTGSGANNGQYVGIFDGTEFQLTGAGGTWTSFLTPNSINYQATFYFYKPNTASGFGSVKSFWGHQRFHGGTDGREMTGYTSGYYDNNNQQSRGISFFSNTGNGIGVNSNVVVYGLKHS